MNFIVRNLHTLFRSLRHGSLFVVASFLVVVTAVSAQEKEETKKLPNSYAERVLADQPVYFWRFNSTDKLINTAQSETPTKFKQVGKVTLGTPGPRTEKFPLFSNENQAIKVGSGANYLKLKDKGENSDLDFDLGDSLTLEAWVNPTAIQSGQTPYIIGKGRTRNEGYDQSNQNYALRMMGKGGEARISFLFRSREGKGGWHRWTSTQGFTIGSGWHHIVVTYTFGQADSLKGYIDGKAVKGKWDYAGKTDKAPVVDDDDLWIGSAQAGIGSNTFNGEIDEIAIYRRALTAKQVASHFKVILPKPYESPKQLPLGEVLVELFEKVPYKTDWSVIHPKPTESYQQRPLAFVEILNKYNAKGLLTDRTNPFLVRASTEFELPSGKHRVLLRSRNGARLFVDNKLVLENGFPSHRGDGHNSIWKMTSDLAPNIRPSQPGDKEVVGELVSQGKKHRFQLDFYAGGKGKRPETGETMVAIQLEGSDDFHVLNHDGVVSLNNASWNRFEDQHRGWLSVENQKRRRDASKKYREDWAKRHAWVREYVSQKTSLAVPAETSLPENNLVDRYINQKLVEQKVEPLPVINDLQFLRRTTVDLIGVPPTLEMIKEYFADQTVSRRKNYISKLLKHAGWADNWMGYWQDVLAENPNVINPTLNNTGPFRYWLAESFRDNKPFDQFATELIMMEGSSRFGGPAGFGVASGNDAPMAAKAHILGQALLGMNMKCARCHDAPFHDFGQRDLFQLSAMLSRREQTIPQTSTINVDAETLAKMQVAITVKPNEKIQPEWPFDGQLDAGFVSELLDDPKDSREQLAWKITSPQNQRFAKVIVNRVWERLVGTGFVETVDDWEHAEPTHPELLEYLARDFMLHNYDLKHLTSTIMNSACYQRKTCSNEGQLELFAGVARRRMTAEQLIDSLFSVAGKKFNTEAMNIDVDGTRLAKISLNFGTPKRAWEFTSLSNERDRPSLSLPAVQTVLNVLENFGWRGSRQDPLTTREKSPSVLQSAILSNGVVGKRITQLSEDSQFTQFALQQQSVEEYVQAVYLAVLTREPSAEELELFVPFLKPDYEARRIEGAKPGPIPDRPTRDGVSWSNHLKPEASELKIDFESRLQAGDAPTTLLETDWRERAEDMVWALINSPEFLLLP